jgi:hypothetical protein
MSDTRQELAAWARVAARALGQDQNTPESQRLSTTALVAFAVELIERHLAEQEAET